MFDLFSHIASVSKQNPALLLSFPTFSTERGPYFCQLAARLS